MAQKTWKEITQAQRYKVWTGEIASGKELFTCEKCGAKFRGWRVRRKHMAEVHVY